MKEKALCVPMGTLQSELGDTPAASGFHRLAGPWYHIEAFTFLDIISQKRWKQLF